MSILLEALRKSEKRERAPAVPDIHTEVPVIRDADRRGPHGLFIAGALLVFALMAWWTWRQFAPVDRQDAVAVATEQVAEQVAGQAADEPTANIPGLDAAAPGEGARTPMEGLSESPPAAEGEAPAGGGEDAAPAADDRPAAPVESRPAPAGTAGRQGQERPGSARPEAADRRPEPISFWALPSGVRDQLPQMRISVLVWAERPEDRFLLLNGRRQLEGDTVSPGLELVEIQRDQAVFTYRMYRFTVSQ